MEDIATSMPIAPTLRDLTFVENVRIGHSLDTMEPLIEDKEEVDARRYATLHVLMD